MNHAIHRALVAQEGARNLSEHARRFYEHALTWDDPLLRRNWLASASLAQTEAAIAHEYARRCAEACNPHGDTITFIL